MQLRELLHIRISVFFHGFPTSPLGAASQLARHSESHMFPCFCMFLRFLLLFLSFFVCPSHHPRTFSRPSGLHFGSFGAPLPPFWPFDFTVFSLRSRTDFTSVSLTFPFDLTLISLRFHFGFTAISLRFYFELTSIPLRCHFDSTSIPLRCQFEFNSISLRFHLYVTLSSLRIHFEHTSISL